jgi:serine/threonine protein kinase
MSSTLPDFTPHGYKAVKELGRNTAGFRTTYQGVDVSSNELIVIKHFEVLPKNVDDWNTLNRMYDEEIQALKGLKHPNIPRFIESFQLQDNSRCIALEYKKGKTLSEARSFSPDEVKSISVSLLEILIYLQDQVPSVKHRDIKPENILVEDVDDLLAVHLVDFGFARIGDGEARTFSSTIKGTFGFMAPEQFRNKSLSNSSDLYGLGATLICLLTGTKSSEIDKLTDDYNYIRFKKLAPGLSLLFIKWLEKMVQPDPTQRYPDAKAALEDLKPLYVRRVPESHISSSSIEFKANKLGEKISSIITVKNPVPETILEGFWEVAPHSSDPPNILNQHAWISFNSNKIISNSNDYIITVDTSKLIADKAYRRVISLHSNTAQQTQYINILVNTAPLPIITKTPPYKSLVGVFLGTIILFTTLYFSMSWFMATLHFYTHSYDVSPNRQRDQTGEVLLIVGAVIGPIQFFVCIIGIICMMFGVSIPSDNIGYFVYCMMGASLTWGWFIWIPLIRMTCELIKGFYYFITDRFSSRKISKSESLIVTALVIIFGIGSSIQFLLPMCESLFSVPSRGGSHLLFGILSYIASKIALAFKDYYVFSGVLLTMYILAPILNRWIKISKYRASEEKLIKP